MRFRVASAAMCLLLSVSARATTVIAPTFEQLVAQAEAVFEGEVIDTKSRLISHQGNEMIVTDVYFRVSKVLKGEASTMRILQFSGGVVGDIGYKVAGVPAFARGDRDIIFAVTSEQMISPIVGVMHGRIRIGVDRGNGLEMVRHFDGTPLRETATLGSKEPQPVLSQKPAMSLSAFESAVVAEVARQAAQKGRRQ